MAARPLSSAVAGAVAGGAPDTPGASVTAPLWRWARKGGITVAGIIMLAAGAAMLVLPGPGLAVIALGLAVLSAEYAWAARLLAGARQYTFRIGSEVRSRLRRGRS